MKQDLISPYIKNLILIAYYNGNKITFRKQRDYAYSTRIGYSINMAFLEKLGIVRDTNKRDGNNEKIWELTDLGKKFASLIIEIEKNEKNKV